MGKQDNIVILCGGKSLRMGTDKAGLLLGEESFLEHLLKNFEEEGHLFLSVGQGRRYPREEKLGFPFQYIEDRVKDCGPLGGLEAVFSFFEGKDRIFITTVDLPLVDCELKQELESYMSPGIDAVIPVAEDGRLHPLCAVYRTGLSEVVKAQLETGNYRVRDFLDRIRVCYVPFSKLTYAKQKLDNINTKEDYERICRYINRKKNVYGIPIISVAAYSGSGKTTFLEKVILNLTERGYRIAVIKHDGHDCFTMDEESKDSSRLAKAGADPVVLYSDTRVVSRVYHPVPVKKLIDEIEDVALILVEGLKHGPYPKILFHREAAEKPLPFDWKKETPLCIVSDKKDWENASCPIFSIEDMEGIVSFLEEQISESGNWKSEF